MMAKAVQTQGGAGQHWKGKTSIADKMRKELIDLRKENRKAERQKTKRLRAELERQKMGADLAVWKIITQVKKDMNATIKSNKHTENYNLRTLSAIPDYYEYQHPKQPRLRTNDKKISWVVQFLSGGGTEKQLMDTAATSRLAKWKKIKWKRGKTDAPASTTPVATKNPLGAGGVG